MTEIERILSDEKEISLLGGRKVIPIERIPIYAKAIEQYVIKAREGKAIFTDEELEYIYDYLDCLENEKLYKQIENKIRKQVKRYRDFDKKRNAYQNSRKE